VKRQDNAQVIASGRDTCQHRGNEIDERPKMSSAGPTNGFNGAIGRVHMGRFSVRAVPLRAAGATLKAGAIQIGADGVRRCPWALSAPECQFYHDREWGRPVDSDERIFEKLCLEGFQSGLSWLTILRRRNGLRRAFDGFNPSVVARYTDTDVARLLEDSAIVRHRGKILAAIGNARAAVRLWEQGISLAGLLWSFEAPAGRPPLTVAALPASTPESEAFSHELRRRGFRFVGPKSAYAAMQSLGVVNDHLDGCRFWVVCDDERRAFTRPR
jgi:DNA-3-methyladenine glycosylase I